MRYIVTVHKPDGEEYRYHCNAQLLDAVVEYAIDNHPGCRVTDSPA